MKRFVIPAVTLFTDTGEIDWSGNRSYAAILNALEIPVLLFGTTGEGSYLTPEEKSGLVEIYGATSLELTLVLDPYFESGIAARYRERVRTMHRPWRGSAEEFFRFHRDSDRSWGIYSHPVQTAVPLGVESLASLVDDESLPWGAKVSKVDAQIVSQMRDIVGADFQLWHGTDRDIVRSAAAGADRVVSQALVVGVPVPDNLLSAQALIDRNRPTGPGKIERLKTTIVSLPSLHAATTRVRTA